MSQTRKAVLFGLILTLAAAARDAAMVHFSNKSVSG